MLHVDTIDMITTFIKQILLIFNYLYWYNNFFIVYLWWVGYVKFSIRCYFRLYLISLVDKKKKNINYRFRWYKFIYSVPVMTCATWNAFVSYEIKIVHRKKIIVHRMASVIWATALVLLRLRMLLSLTSCLHNRTWHRTTQR